MPGSTHAGVAGVAGDGTPDVVVSIVNHSQCDLTLECLESLERDGRRRCSVEIVVLDNGSSDGCPDTIASRFPTVRVIRQRRRAGFGANHNTVARATSSRYVFLLNPDTAVCEGALDALVDYLDARPHVAVAGPAVYGFDGAHHGSAWRLMSIPVQLAWAATLGARGVVLSRGDAPRRVGAVSACAMLVRRQPFEQIGLFDETYFMYVEEADAAQRLEQLGLEHHYVPSAEVLHHGQATTTEVPERQVNEFWRSLDIYLGRYHSRTGAAVLRATMGVGYALAALAAELGRRLPARLRPAAADAWDPGIYRLHVRDAFRGTRDPGLRELAEDWNDAHGGWHP